MVLGIIFETRVSDRKTEMVCMYKYIDCIDAFYHLTYLCNQSFEAVRFTQGRIYEGYSDYIILDSGKRNFCYFEAT